MEIALAIFGLAAAVWMIFAARRRSRGPAGSRTPAGADAHKKNGDGGDGDGGGSNGGGD
jgi:hypothetical protein